jgi:hypothetical protein
LNKAEFDFFLKGNTSLDEVEQKPHAWISPNGWKDACRTASLGDAWDGFVESLKKDGAEW